MSDHRIVTMLTNALVTVIALHYNSLSESIAVQLHQICTHEMHKQGPQMVQNDVLRGSAY